VDSPAPQNIRLDPLWAVNFSASYLAFERMRGNESMYSLSVITEVLGLGPLVLVDFLAVKFLVPRPWVTRLLSMMETFIF
jgi:hypothetical protein